MVVGEASSLKTLTVRETAGSLQAHTTPGQGSRES